MLPAQWNIIAFKNADFEQEFEFSDDLNVLDYEWYGVVEGTDDTDIAVFDITKMSQNNAIIISLTKTKMNIEPGTYRYWIWLSATQEYPVIEGTFTVKYAGKLNGN